MSAPVREAVRRYVAQHPGVHGREVERALGLAAGTATYHLRELAAAGRLVQARQGGYVRYAPPDGAPNAGPAGGWTPDDMEVAGLLRRRPALLAVQALLDGPASHGDLTSALGLAKSSVTYHLGMLERAGVVARAGDGRQARWLLRDADRLRTLLDAMTPVPEELDPFTRLLDDLMRRDPEPAGPAKAPDGAGRPRPGDRKAPRAGRTRQG